MNERHWPAAVVARHPCVTSRRVGDCVIASVRLSLCPSVRQTDSHVPSVGQLVATLAGRTMPGRGRPTRQPYRHYGPTPPATFNTHNRPTRRYNGHIVSQWVPRASLFPLTTLI